jgi:hypothetical protein
MRRNPLGALFAFAIAFDKNYWPGVSGDKKKARGDKMKFVAPPGHVGPTGSVSLFFRGKKHELFKNRQIPARRPDQL